MVMMLTSTTTTTTLGFVAVASSSTILYMSTSDITVLWVCPTVLRLRVNVSRTLRPGTPAPTSSTSSSTTSTAKRSTILIPWPAIRLTHCDINIRMISTCSSLIFALNLSLVSILGNLYATIRGAWPVLLYCALGDTVLGKSGGNSKGYSINRRRRNNIVDVTNAVC